MAWLRLLPDLIWIVGFPLMLFWIVGLLVWMGFPYRTIRVREAPSRLRKWADRHRLKIIDCGELCVTWRGVFTARTSSETLYGVVFEDNQGERRSAWVLCRCPQRRSSVDQVEVRWDETDEAPPPTAAWFESRRRVVKAIGRVGSLGLLLGPCGGFCIGAAMLLSAGLIQSVAAVPLLMFSVLLGALVGIVGGLFGMVGVTTVGWIKTMVAWIKHDAKPKYVIDEL